MISRHFVRQLYKQGVTAPQVKKVPRSQGTTLSKSLIVKRGMLVTGVSCAGLAGYFYSTDEGVQRSLTFWKVVLPKYMRYKMTQKYITVTKKTDKEALALYEQLHDKYTNDVRDACLGLRGFYLKAAQIMSTIDYFIPEQYLVWCKKLQDQAPTVLNFEQAKKLIPIEYFAEIDEEPIGSASIGQVYRGKLKPEYQKKFGLDFEYCAIKVQAPGTEAKFRADLATLIMFCNFALPQFVESLKEIERQFEFEFDFALEAVNQSKIYEKIEEGRKYKQFRPFLNKVVVPRTVKDLCTKEVLIMECLSGKSLIKGVRTNLRTVSTMLGKDYDELEAKQMKMLKEGTLEFKSLKEDSKYTNDVNRYLEARRWMLYFASFIPFSNISVPRYHKMVNLGEIIQVASMTHGFEIMFAGLVNGDPHPGNILLLDDGRLGLIDYGQVKDVSPRSQVLFAKLMLALNKNDVDEVFDVAVDLGWKTKNMNKQVIYKVAKFWADTNGKEVTEGKNVHMFLEEMEQRDPTIDVATDMVIPGRVSFLLRAIGNAFGIDMHMTDLWYDLAILRVKGTGINLGDDTSASDSKV